MKQIKKFLKKFYILRLLNLYRHQWVLKTLYSTDEKKEKYIEKKFKENVGYEIDFSKEQKHLMKKYNLENYMIKIHYIQYVQINIE